MARIKVSRFSLVFGSEMPNRSNFGKSQQTKKMNIYLSIIIYH